MSIAKLKEHEQMLIAELEDKTHKRDAFCTEEKAVDVELESMYSAHERLSTQYRSMCEKAKDNSRKIRMLRRVVEEYRNSKRQDARVALAREYAETVEKARHIDFDLNLDVLEKFEALKSLRGRFEGLNRRIDAKYAYEKSRLKDHLYKEALDNIGDPKGLHRMFLYLRFIQKYEEAFEEDIFTGLFFEDISRNFTYHFLSDKETNRLDKPEWMFKFLHEKLRSYSQFFGAFSKPLSGLLVRVPELVNIKARELEKCNSDQKKSLVWHFVDEFEAFSDAVLEEYDHAFDGAEICSLLLGTERDHVEATLLQIHDMGYTQWWDEYRKLATECLYFYRKYRSIEQRCINVFVYLMDNIIESCKIFIDQMRFISRKEVKVLCHFYSQIESFKAFVSEEETEIFLQCENELEISTLQKMTSKVTRFNKENLSLLLSLIENDVSQLLRHIRGFSRVQENDRVSFVIDLTTVLHDYKRCVSYRVLATHCQKQVDSFLVDQIVVKHKMDSEQYLQFRELFKSLQNVFGDQHWNTSAGLDCIEAIFNGTECCVNKPLHKRIEELYTEH